MKRVFFFCLKKVFVTRVEKNYLETQHVQHSAGFSMVELLAVILIAGILAAIVGPSWLGFMSRQRVNKANDAMLLALQSAQREARKNKRSYSLSFRTDNGVAQIAIHLSSDAPNWRNLGEDVGVKPGEVVLGTNLSNKNTAGSTVSFASGYNSSAPQTISFDAMGTLPDVNFGTAPSGSTQTPGLRVAVAIPQSGNSTQPTAIKRCVILETLIGGMRTAKDGDCS